MKTIQQFKKLLILSLLFMTSFSFGQETIVVDINHQFWKGGQLSTNYTGSYYSYLFKDNTIYRADGNNWIKTTGNFYSPTVSNFVLQYFFVDNDNVVWLYDKTNKVISKSTDNGNSWTFIDIPKTTTDGYWKFVNIKIFVKNKRLYFSAYANNSRSILMTFDYSNANNSWESLFLNNNGGSNGLGSYNFQVFDDGSIWDGNYISFDNGFSWTEKRFDINSPTPLVKNYNSNDIELLISDDKKMIFSSSWKSNHKKYFSSNGGLSFTEAQGLPFNVPIRRMKFCKNVIVCESSYGTNGERFPTDGIYISNDNGLNFSKLNTGLSLWDSLQIIDFTSDNTSIYVSSDSGFKKVSISNTAGIDFNNGVNNIVPHHILKLDTDLSGKIYALCGIFDGYYPSQAPAYGLFVSEDEGNTWRKDENLFDKYLGQYDFSAASNNIVYAVGYSPGKLNKSSDSGINWSYLSRQHTPYSVRNVFADKNDSNRVIICSYPPDPPSEHNKYGTFLSKDSGNSFGDISGGFSSPIDKEISRNVLFYDTNTIYMLFEGRIMKSINNGKTWVKISNQNLYKIVVNKDSGRMYGFNDINIYESNDMGTTWNLFTPILGTPIITDLFVTSHNNNQYIIASTKNGVFSFILSNYPASDNIVNSSWSQKTATAYNKMIWNPKAGALFATNGFGITKIGRNDLILSPPTGEKSQHFCIGSKVKDLVVQTSGIAYLKWYDSATGGNLIDPTTTLVNGKKYFASLSTAYNESLMRLEVIATVQNTAPPTGKTMTFCKSSRIGFEGLKATGIDVKWYDSAVGGKELIPYTYNSCCLINGNSYYASQTINGCESQSRLAVKVILIDSPAPTGPSKQAFSASKTVADLIAFGLPSTTDYGTNVLWYRSESDGNTLPKSTALLNNTYYYARQIVYDKGGNWGCGSEERLAVFVTSDIISTPIVSIVGEKIGTIPWETDQDLITTDGVNYYLYNFYMPSSEFKFRQDHTSTIIWGGQLSTGTFPTSVGIRDGFNIPAINGTYDITFNRLSGLFSFKANLSTTQNEYSKTNIKCYPNPTTNILNISSQETIKQINIYNLLGALLKSQKGSSDNEKMSIQDLPNATYLVEIKTDKETQTVKIIKE